MTTEPELTVEFTGYFRLHELTKEQAVKFALKVQSEMNLQFKELMIMWHYRIVDETGMVIGDSRLPVIPVPDYMAVPDFTPGIVEALQEGLGNGDGRPPRQ